MNKKRLDPDEYVEVVRKIGKPCTLWDVMIVTKRSYSQTAKVLKKLREDGVLGRMYARGNWKTIYYYVKS
jgi:DNA-binding transcriptional regulator GbsR (MarR family)